MGEGAGLLLVLLLLLLVTAVAVVLLVKHLQLLGQFNARVRREVEAWREREVESLKARLWEAARSQAGAELDRWKLDSEATIRDDAVRRSQAVISGKVTEHLTPYLGPFPYNPKDVRFLGTPVDLIVFDGLSEGELHEIVFLEVKTGKGDLSTRERRVRDVVLEGRVSWREFRVAPG